MNQSAQLRDYQRPDPYAGEVDPRLKALSYSSILTLHSCPRKFELAKRKMDRTRDQSVTFAFGHAVGEGIQGIATGLSWNQVVWNMFMAWNEDLLAEEARDKKSFWYAVHAVGSFQNQAASLLDGYELAMIPSSADPSVLVPATELSFRIQLPDDYFYVGYVDLVLVHKVTKQLLVLEVKTTKFTTVNEASYKNSAQAIGYSVVLDTVSTEHTNDYRVMYLVYKSGAMEFEPLIFPKTFTQRATWIQQILLDIDLIEGYWKAQLFPMYGESCFNFFRECEELYNCTLSTANQITPYPQYLERVAHEVATGSRKEKTYTINITLADLINSQLAKHLVGDI